MLDLEIVPERSLGCDAWEFVLGMHFSQSVAIIQSQVGTIRGVQVLYSDQNPLSVDLVINMPQDGIRLIFDPVAQRLKIIEIYNMKLVKLRYSGMCFNSPEITPSIEQVEHCFGATHPGLYDSQRHLFALNFRGLSFYFPVDSKFEPGYAHGLGSLQFPNGGSPVVSRTTIYYGSQHQLSRSSSGGRCAAPLADLPLSCYRHQLHLRRCDVLRNATATLGLRLHIYTEGGRSGESPLARRRVVRFGDSCQAVARALAAPARLYYKADDKMRIHRPTARRRPPPASDYFFNYFTLGLVSPPGVPETPRSLYYEADDKMRIHRPTARRRPPPASDYFFNYFTLGLDVLFDARTHQVKKFVLHTNYPGHYNFNMYHRCEFELTVQPDKCESNALVESRGAVQITAYSRWEGVSRALRVAERPVVLNRASSTNTTNPFGSTFCYGYQDIIFEVMSNNYIASITLYQPEGTRPHYAVNSIA
ncbi:PHAF1 protein CG7083 [Epargyreus clarus]|uniref:PHAF1 protein CG7083 n=1 Tax=Epargyreus clarus TaxID=520877 RepID=UPI003C2C035D